MNGASMSKNQENEGKHLQKRKRARKNTVMG